MGGLTQALAAAAQGAGRRDPHATPRSARILVKDGAADGVALADGDEFRAPVVASNADANVTFNRLMDNRLLPPAFAEAINRISYDSASLKINVALSELPDFTRLPGRQRRAAASRHHPHLSRSGLHRTRLRRRQVRPAVREARSSNARCRRSSIRRVAPPGQHLMSMFIQYAPYKLREGNWDDLREPFADRCFDLLNEYAPNFKRSVIARQVLTPLDLERTFSLTGGNIFQGAMTLNQLFFLRPVVGLAGYRTPIRGLYLCGAAAHPGGGVIGAAGWNAARVILGKA